MLKIMGVRPDGTEFYCFHWRGSEQSGILRAIADCVRFGVEIYDVRAVQCS